MRYRPLGDSGIEASVVGLGAWAIGGWMWGGQDDDHSIRAIQAAIDAGMNLIDTAPVYGFGRSETIVGKAIAGRRDKVVLATKCGLIWDREAGQLHFTADEHRINPESGHIRVYRYNNPASIRAEVEASLKRLNTDHLDLLQTHWQEPTTPIADTMGEMMRLKQQGKIRAIGVSNASIEQMDQYRAAGQLDTDQEKYSMLDRGLDQAVLPYLVRHHIALLAYSPLANGLLTGRITPDRRFPDGDLRSFRPRFSVENRQRVIAMLDELRPFAEAHGWTLGQLAIGWAIAQPGVTHALVGARSPQQVAENAAAAEPRLSPDEMTRIDAIIARHRQAIE